LSYFLPELEQTSVLFDDNKTRFIILEATHEKVDMKTRNSYKSLGLTKEKITK